MSGRRGRHRVVAMLLMLAGASGACGGPEARPDPAAPTRMRLAVLGNSDSHAFHDSVAFGEGSPERGGPQRAVTFQWTEILARLRGDAIDQGAWGTRGVHPRIARVAAWVGVRLRSPRKQDHAWNVAYSGARCANLTGPRGQVEQLRYDIARDPEAWRDGLVLFRIGINDIGRREVLERISREGDPEAFRALARACTDTILASVRTLRGAQPALRIALVGLLDNADWPPHFDLFKDAKGLAAQRQLLDAFDGALRAFAAATPGVAFIDDRAAFAARWGSASIAGDTIARAYRVQHIGGLEVTLSQGDALTHAAVADGHAGTVFNAYWVQALVAELDRQLGMRIPPVTDAELDAFVRGLAAR